MKPFSEYNDAQLLAQLATVRQAEDKRNKASKHDKFKKMEFPTVNPEFTKMKNELIEEIRKRKLNESW